MDSLTGIIILVVLIVIALIVVNSGVRTWVIKLFGVESRVEGRSNVTKINAKQSTVRKVINEEGLVDIDAKDGTEVEDVRNKRTPNK
ncbi:MAG: hypothetical protein LCI00_27365 [Chloroflexi bacterium]|nr:hypothetical protein [Chloroflexota bacterium]MCC6897211.1 hypothetical protein [Anaerolineae bacterium]